jgi:hypothetical protein
MLAYFVYAGQLLFAGFGWLIDAGADFPHRMIAQLVQC